MSVNSIFIKSLWRSACADFEKVGAVTKIFTGAGVMLGVADLVDAIPKVTTGEYRHAAVEAGFGIGILVADRLNLRFWAWYTAGRSTPSR
jgi:hypothetical protein